MEGNWAIPRNSNWIYQEAKIIDEETIFATSASTDVTTMKRTTDGGLTWMNLSLPSNYQMLKCIQFFDPNIAYAGLIFRSQWLWKTS
ncbi:MAG: hypothetical protein IPN18_12595 [Ignavibacteriales bacterium]|nr:hypothetical protein [Ignavibacteriales bacterium]